MPRPITTEPLRQAIAAILRESPLLTASEIVSELEVAGHGDLIPLETVRPADYIQSLIYREPSIISIERVEIVPIARTIKRYALVAG